MILQPPYWLYKDDDGPAAIPFLPGDADGAKLQAELAEEARLEAVRAQAENLINYREAGRLADQLQAERSGKVDSWAPVDIADLFDTEQQQPEIGEFATDDLSNGGSIFYAGKVNEVHGPSESGKTMFVLAVAAQEVKAGRSVVMIDYEDDGRAIVNRLRYVFGLDRGEIEKHFHYFHPEVAFTEAAFSYIAGIENVSMGIIDAVTEGMSIAGLDGRNENDVATWYNDFPKRLAGLGMGVVIIDHTPNDNASRQIGSQHKKSGVDGVSYTADPIRPFVKGQGGHLRLLIAKDKVGSIRPDSLSQGPGKQYWRGDFRIDKITGSWSLRGVDPSLGPAAEQGKAHDVKNVEVPSPYLAVVLEILAESGEWMSAQAICDWHNQGMDPKDPGRLSRTDPRKRCVKLIAKGLAERRDGGGTVVYRVTPDGLHSANAWANRRLEDGQEELPES